MRNRSAIPSCRVQRIGSSSILALYAPGYTTTRVWLHRMRGVTIGNNVSIGLSALIETAYPRLVSIGNNVTIGMRVIIIGHLRDSTSRRGRPDRHTVRIEDNAYIGPGVIILPNVTIGQGAVVSAGSVVSRSVPPRTLVRGNPASTNRALRCIPGWRRLLRGVRPEPEAHQRRTAFLVNSWSTLQASVVVNIWAQHTNPPESRT